MPYPVGMTARGWISLACVALCVTPSLASFEMVLVLDRGSRKVHRFDGVTGAYFGSFGAFSSNVKSIALERSTNRAYVWDASSGNGVLTTWNYNTGEMVGFVDGWNPVCQWFGPDLDPTRYLIAVNNSVERRTWPQTYSGAISLNVGSTMNLEGYAGGLVAFGSTGMQYVSSAFVAGASIALTGNLGFGTVSSGDFGTCGIAPRLTTNGGYYVPLAGGSFSFTRTWAASSLTNVVAVGAAHSGFYALGKNASNAAQGRVTKLGLGNSTAFEFNSFGESYLTDPVGIAVVVAPEPASFVAFGAGMAALIARRRRASRS